MKKWLYNHIFPSLGYFFISILSSTLRIKVTGEEALDTLRAQGQKLVYAFWHGNHFLLVKYMSHKHVCIMASTSRDGKLLADILIKFGYEIAFGSSNKSPVRALVDMIGKMRKGWDAALAIDGPKGPVYKVKPGAVYLAKKMNAPIIPLTFTAERAKVLNTWDRYVIPGLFSKCHLKIGDPVYLSDSLDEQSIQQDCIYIEKVLNELQKDAACEMRR